MRTEKDLIFLWFLNLIVKMFQKWYVHDSELVLLKRIVASFYKNSLGNEPVREWFLELSKEDRKLIGEDVKTVELGWPIGMPTCRPMGAGLFEVRSHLTGARIARVLFAVAEGQMILLHAFIKKTQKTPDSDLDLARRRRREVLGS